MSIGCGSALAAVNDGDTIDFSVTTPATITLTSGELLVDKSLTIDGPGADMLAVDANHTSRVFHISSGKTVTISGLTITNGSVGGPTPNDGWGGGIYNDHAVLTIDNCSISGNVANRGGGIFNDATTSGTATLSVNNSTISGNTAVGDGGGGIFSGPGLGGPATVSVNNSTISGNSAPGQLARGGGIFNTAAAGIAELVVNNSTFDGNSAAFGGSISNTDHGGTMTIRSTILRAASNANIDILFGATVISLGYNLSSDNASTYLNQTTDQNSTDPLLGPLQDNGGPTFTHELLIGSPAIDKGKSFSGSTTDQRGTGFARTYDDPAVANATGGDGTDIGAFEVQAATPTPTPYAAQIQQPINADGTSVFNVRRGVVPIKFTLTVNGAATCDLPAATIAVTRTAGGTLGPVDESSYSGPADTGSNFRIDSCQYVYNLSASALGVGTYRVDIFITGQVVGSATFALR